MLLIGLWAKRVTFKKKSLNDVIVGKAQFHWQLCFSWGRFIYVGHPNEIFEKGFLIMLYKRHQPCPPWEWTILGVIVLLSAFTLIQDRDLAQIQKTPLYRGEDRHPRDGNFKTWTNKSKLGLSSWLNNTRAKWGNIWIAVYLSLSSTAPSNGVFVDLHISTHLHYLYYTQVSLPLTLHRTTLFLCIIFF